MSVPVICVTDRYSQKLLEALPEPKTVWKYMLAIAQIPRGSNKKGECVIPEYAMECSGYCGECVGGKSCWNMGKGEAVVFNEH